MMIFAVFFFLQLGVSQTQLFFDQGNQRLKEQDYLGAIEQYQQINTDSWQSGALWLNLGLAYTQIDSLGKAKAFYLQALEFDETQKDAQKGLEYVTKKLPQKAASLPKLPWDYVLEWTIKLGSTSWSWLTLVFAYLTLILFVIRLFYFRESKVVIRIIIGILFLTVAFGAAALYTDYVYYRYGKAVLISSQSNLNKTATNDAELVSLAFEGYEFTVDYLTTDQNPDWMYVRMSNGVFGWIKRSDIHVF